MSVDDFKEIDSNNKNIEIDENLVEIINKIKKEKKLTKEEISKLEDDAKQSLNFLQLIDEIKLPTNKYVVFTDGEEQLIYENGEFFVVSSTDNTKLKKKKKRSEATDMYIEYFIRYILNRINKQKEMDMMVKEITSGNAVLKNNIDDKSKGTDEIVKEFEKKSKINKKQNVKKELNIKSNSEKTKDDLVR